MRNYVRQIMFYLLELISDFVNLLCSLVGWYPGVCLGLSFMVHLEYTRISKEKRDMAQNREQSRTEAEMKMAKIKFQEEIENGSIQTEKRPPR